jgi:hypothetical protein
MNAMAPPSIFGFPISVDPAPQGVIHSFLAVPVISKAPTGYTDNFDFSICADSLPICAEVLGDVVFTTAVLDKLFNGALLPDVSVAFNNLASTKTQGAPLPIRRPPADVSLYGDPQ